MNKIISLTAIFVLAFFMAKSQIYFGDPNLIVAGGTDGVNSLYHQDLDGDGDMDIISASHDDDKIAWYPNSNGGVIGPQLIISTNADYAFDVHAADLDGDGDYDVLSASSDDNKIAWYENTDGFGSFGNQQIITTNAFNARDVHAADLDGDGDMDVLSASFDDDKVAWYENTDGNGNFSSEKIITLTANGAFFVNAYDIDGDTDLDILIGSENDDKVVWYENTDGNGNFTQKQIIYQPTSKDINSISAMDCDNDGDLDVITLFDGTELAWFDNIDGSGVFGSINTIDVEAPAVDFISLGDLSGDGFQDIIVSSSNGSYFYTNTPNYSSKFSSVKYIKYKASHSYAADMNGDGSQDILYFNQAYNNSFNYPDVICWIENQDGCGYFGSDFFAQTSTSPSEPQILFTSDINGNAYKDVVSKKDDNTLKWYKNNGNGRYFSEYDILSTTGNNHINSATSGDMDGDGDYDIVYSCSNDVHWNENDGNGNFGIQHSFSSQDDVYNLSVVDIDNDGDLDILGVLENDGDVICFRSENGSFPYIEILAHVSFDLFKVIPSDIDGDNDLDLVLNSYQNVFWVENYDGNGNFGSPILIESSVFSYDDIFLVDLDNDNDNDIIATKTSTPPETVNFENTDGLGAFQKTSLLNIGGQTLAASDMDGDGDNDILLCPADEVLSWFENAGFECYNTRHQIGKGNSLICSVDNDNDGDIDIITLQENSNPDDHLFCYNNKDGNGTYYNNILTPTASDTKHVFVADINNDGNNDVLTASFNDNKIAWYDNQTGYGLFESQNIVSTDILGAKYVSAGDLDGDGDQDILSASYTDGTIAWHKNCGEELYSDPIILIDDFRAFAVKPVDVDDDGDLDVVGIYSTSTYLGSNKLILFKNTDGNANFDNGTIIITSGSPSCFVTGDIDGDGDTDIACASTFNSYLEWCENYDGQGSYSWHWINSSFATPHSISLADFDNDQDLDVASVSKAYDKLSWFENYNGIGNFGPEIQISDLIDGPTSLATSDLDQDGDFDIVTSSIYDDKICWFENLDGLATFSSQQIITNTADSVSYAITTDLNNDTKPDIVFITEKMEEVSWIENSPSVQIIYQPQNQEVCPNSNASFSIQAMNAQSYQWQLDEGSGYINLNNNSVYSGVTTETLLISSASTSLDNNLYRCEVTGISNTVFSNPAVLTVDDTEDPVITSIPEDQTVYADENCEAILSDYTTDVTATDNCDDFLDITQSPSPGTIISDSINEVVITVTDDLGNYSTDSFNVSVIDTIAPDITSTHEDQTLYNTDICEVSLPDYTADVTATDNCDSDLEVSQDPAPGTMISGLINTVTLTVSDDAGNTDEVSFNAEVLDTITPNIQCVPDQIINLDPGQTTYTVQGTEFDPISYSDNCEVTEISNNFNNQSTLAGATFPADTTLVAWLAEDEQGNMGSCSFNVIVNIFVSIDVLSESSISIYPNPTNGMLHIDFGHEQAIEFTVYDVIGKLLLHKTGLQDRELINMSVYDNGLYYLSILTESKRITSKIIKK